MQPMTSKYDLIENEAEPQPTVLGSYATLAEPPAAAIMSMILPRGQHDPATWQREFSFALQHLYRPSRNTDAHRVPIAHDLMYLSPALGTAPGSPPGDGDDTTTAPPTPSAAPSGTPIDELGFKIDSQIDSQNKVSDARFAAMEETNKETAQKTDALTALL